jgi:copper chaperone CopZ
MRKSYKLEGDICPNCASKIETKIRKLDGVNDAKVNFLMMKFTLDADDASYDQALRGSLKAFDDIEPSCKVRA